MLKIATVCTGIGSPEQALKQLGIPHKIVFGCEIDKYARQTYLANFGDVKMYEDMTKEEWINPEDYADLFIGGIPCQSFSLAGKRLGELDPRGLLFFDFYRYVKNQRPKYFIIENVKGLLSDNDGKTFRNWINLLGQSENGNGFFFPHEDSLMYNLHWEVLNSKDFGVPQNRERVFLIGIRNDLPNDFTFPKGLPLTKRLKDVLENEVDEKYFLSEKIIYNFKNRPHKENYPFRPIDLEKEKKRIACCLNARYNKMGATDNYIKVDVIGNLKGGKWDKMHEQSGRVYGTLGIAPTIHTMQGGNQEPKITNKDRIRKLTPKECFRLQGFSDEFHDKAVKAGVSNSQLYKQAGNSITVNVMQSILKNLLKNDLP